MGDGQWAYSVPARDQAAELKQKKPWATPRVIEGKLEDDTENAFAAGADFGIVSTS